MFPYLVFKPALNLGNYNCAKCNPWLNRSSSSIPSGSLTILVGVFPRNKSTAGYNFCSFSMLFVAYYISVSFEMGGGGFEPPKQFAADLQSVPFGHSGIHPYVSLERLRTHFLSVTKKLYHIFVETASIIFIYCNALFLYIVMP